METTFRLQKQLSANGNIRLSASGNFCYQANTTGFLFGQFGAQCYAFFVERRQHGSAKRRPLLPLSGRGRRP
jgi:hypothetical protein